MINFIIFIHDSYQFLILIEGYGGVVLPNISQLQSVGVFFFFGLIFLKTVSG